MTNWLQRLIWETQVQILGLLRRSRQSTTSLASALGLTDHAVRMHIAALHRDGIVDQVGTARDTGGKPARLYGLTPEGEELFPKAYALVLRKVGAQAAAAAPRGANPKRRMQAAAQAFRDLGADAEVERAGKGWRLQAYGCPLSAVTAGHPELCELGKALVQEVVGEPVTECCQRGDHPRCAFEIAGTAT